MHDSAASDTVPSMIPAVSRHRDPRQYSPGTGPAPAPAPQVIHPLTGIRALAAAWVVLLHFQEPLLLLLPALRPLAPLTGGGYLGVEVFFVLSGFVISHNYAEQFRRFDLQRYRRYLSARAARIYPVHLATFAVMGLLVAAAAAAGVELSSAGRNTPMNFLANVFMLQAFPGFYGVNWPAWSVSCEAAAYVVFPVLALVVVRCPRWPAFAGAMGVLALGVAVIQVVGEPGGSVAYPMMWLRITVEFTAGCLLWAFWRARGMSGSTVAGDVLALASVAVTVAVLYAVPANESPQSFFALPALALFVLGCANAGGPLGALLSSRWMQWAGRVSYSLYMTHFIVYVVAKKVLRWDYFAGAELAVRLGVVVICLASCVAAAAVTYYAVEEPGRRLVRRALARGRRPKGES